MSPILAGVSSTLIISLEKTGLNLSHFWLLEAYFLGIEVDCSEYGALFQRLQRKLFLNELGITEAGKALYEELRGTVPEPGVIKKKVTQIKAEKEIAFKEWWKAYPSSTTFIDVQSNQKYHGGQTRRQQEEKTRGLYYKLLDKFSHQDLLDYTVNKVNELKAKTIRGWDKREENHLNYLPVSFRFLEKEDFEGGIESLRQMQEQELKLVKKESRVDPKILF